MEQTDACDRGRVSKPAENKQKVVRPNFKSIVIKERQPSVMDDLLDYVRQSKLDSGIAFTGLFAAQGKEAFYETFGFKNHAPGMTGMFNVFEVK